MERRFESSVHAFGDSLERHPDEVAVRVHMAAEGGTVVDLTYAKLFELGRCAAAGLAAHGLRHGARIVVALGTSPDFFALYVGCLMAGFVPTVISPPRPKRPVEAYASLVSMLVLATGSELLVTEEPHVAALREHMAVKLATPGELFASRGAAAIELRPPPGQLAHLQPTSGSTGIPRLAEVRHGNIGANTHCIGLGVRHRPGDVLLSWLPLFHDMGLIGFSYSLYWQCPLVMTDPLNFARDPMIWMELMSQFRGTLSPAPNSAYKVCARLARRRPVEQFDLSAWRVALCGAEPVQLDSLRHFSEAFAAAGFRPQTMLPVYGLAEATLAATMPDPEIVPEVEMIAVERMQQGECCPAASGEQSVPMVALGAPIEGHRLRIVDTQGNVLAERVVGEVEFSGPSVVDGYWGISDESLKRKDGFLRTGDLGYMANGQLFITGRKKDIIIAHGRNFVPAQIEAVVEAAIHHEIVDGIAAVGLLDLATNTEGVHVVIEAAQVPRIEAPADEEHIQQRLDEVFGLRGVTIWWVPKGWIPKTTSRKIQRYRCNEKLNELRLQRSSPSARLG